MFVVFLYQRWIYRIDPTRVNEFGCGPCLHQRPTTGTLRLYGTMQELARRMVTVPLLSPAVKSCSQPAQGMHKTGLGGALSIPSTRLV